MYIYSITDSYDRTVHIKSSELKRVLRDFGLAYIYIGSISTNNVIYDINSKIFIYRKKYRFTRDRYIDILINYGVKHDEYKTSSEPSSSSESETDEPVKKKSKKKKYPIYKIKDSENKIVKIKKTEIHRVLFDFGKAYEHKDSMYCNSAFYYSVYKLFCYRGEYNFRLRRIIKIILEISLKHEEYKTSSAPTSENESE